MRLRLRIAATAVALILTYTLYNHLHPVTWDPRLPPLASTEVERPWEKGPDPDRIQASGVSNDVTSVHRDAPVSSRIAQTSQVSGETSATVAPDASSSSLRASPSNDSGEKATGEHHIVPTSLQHLRPTEVAGEHPINGGHDLAHISEAPASSPSPITKDCPPYERLQRLRQKPLSEGKRQFPYSRPDPECRTFNLPSLEMLITRMKGVISDPDFFRLFENSYPNTLDTMVKWRGYATATDPTTKNTTATDEELTYLITGDIDAMWLRDSASQIYSYLPLLEASSDPDSLASLWRGVINLHARYILISPYCHSFQPPPESGIPPTHNGAYSQNNPQPAYDPVKVFDCKWELDSLASFLQISTAYYERTNDLSFFQKYNWIPAVSAAVKAAGAMRLGTYSPEGKVESSAWTFTGWTNRGSETLTNDGLGNPTKENGMVRTAFRPSDDACIYQLLVPANMMWAKYLEEGSLIMEQLDGAEAKNLTTAMREFAFGVRKAIDRDAVVRHRDFGDIWAYEIDGYGGVNLMDDANIPSLLAIPLYNYTQSSFPLPSPPEEALGRNYAELYNNTRNFVLSDGNPYYMRGPVLSAVGGPHLGPGRPWPMAAIVRAITAIATGKSDEVTQKAVEEEVEEQIRMVLDSTTGTGVVHETVNAWNENIWSRAWFGWANGLLGELVLKIEQEDKRAGRTGGGWLAKSWQ